MSEPETGTAPRTGTAPGGLREPADDAATRVFVDHRDLLFSVVYNMLGSVADAEDVLQETWLSWVGRIGRSQTADIDHPRAYLVRIAVNHALAGQAGAARRRETYIGQWLPEPLVTGGTGTGRSDAALGPAAAAGDASDAADRALRTESVSMALLVVLETLTPLERAVFVLHEVFGYAHTEIAGILDRSPSAVRQLARRAREHVHARRPRFRTRPRVQRQVTERFVAAALGGDVGTLMEILAPDVAMWSDGGGKVRSAPRPILGREKVARMVAGFAARPREGLDIRYRSVNGDLSVVVYEGGAPYGVMVMDLTPDGDQVSGVYLVINPDKLSDVRRSEGD
ncbi:RNA polymerase sigma factor SigJ [Streptomyces niveus]|uniref:RNA polymerase sigma factor SigJ n=1 Tax=Streptomyces niveus TaxID=193462 RepID=UPI000990642E|nr:RNA polymerase sigma factor SigJ [Streptomyces niveus]